MLNRQIHIEQGQSVSKNQAVTLHDPEKFKSIWHQQQPHMLMLATRFLQNEQAAEDVATDCFIKLWNSDIVFPSEFAVIGWLRTTVRNTCLNLLKQQEKQHERLMEMSRLLSSEEDEWYSEDLLAHRLQQLHLQIAALPERARQIFKLRYLEGLNNEAIANQLGISHQTVRNQLAIALKNLRLSLRHRHDLLLLLSLFCQAHFDR